MYRGLPITLPVAVALTTPLKFHVTSKKGNTFPHHLGAQGLSRKPINRNNSRPVLSGKVLNYANPLTPIPMI